jgi:hypothetical protein
MGSAGQFVGCRVSWKSSSSLQGVTAASLTAPRALVVGLVGLGPKPIHVCLCDEPENYERMCLGYASASALGGGGGRLIWNAVCQV